MSYMVKSLDKRSGITYVYETSSYWDKEKKQARSKRTLIGKWDPVTEQILPTDGRGKKRKQVASRDYHREQLPTKPGPLPICKTERLFFGATYLFDEIGRITGITADLKTCFPYTYKKILSIAYYLILEDSNPLLRFNKWARLHRHPYEGNISSQRSSELFQSITEEAKMRFFRLQGQRRIEHEFWAYDTTSISSRSECLRQVRYGNNKDHELLPQVNLALLFGEKSGLPFYYRKLAGNIPDVKTIHEMIRELDILQYGKVKLVMDRGFYSADNINQLYRGHYKFIVGTKATLTYAKQFITAIESEKDALSRYNDTYELYVFSKTIAWDYEQKRPYKGDVIKEEKRMYLHLYYNPDKAADDGKGFNRRIMKMKEELLADKRIPAHAAAYDKFFVVKKTPKRGIQVTVNEEACKKARTTYGFFVLISNEVKDPITALQLYRTRNVVERAFWNLKERLNCRRTLVSSESGLEGKLFVEFIALIYLSYIKKKMEEQKLFGKHTMQELLDELDVIECFTEPGKAPIQGEVLQKQEDLYIALGVTPLLAKPKDL